MFEKRKEIGKIQLWEADDRWVIQTIEGYISVPFAEKLTSRKVKELCKQFGIQYDKNWCVYGGTQLNLNKNAD